MDGWLVRRLGRCPSETVNAQLKGKVMTPESTDPHVAGKSSEQTQNSCDSTCRKGGPFSGGFGVFVVVILFLGAGYLTYRTIFQAEITEVQAVPRVFKCVETDKVFTYKLSEGEHWPVMSEASGKKTAYPTESCFWTKDGKQKHNPDYVILNEYLDKPGDTFCPVCGRLVIGHNPVPPSDTPFAEEPAGNTPSQKEPAQKEPAKESPVVSAGEDAASPSTPTKAPAAAE